jgi:hypothetical protein
MSVIVPVVLGTPYPTDLKTAQSKAKETFAKIQKETHSGDGLISPEEFHAWLQSEPGTKKMTKEDGTLPPTPPLCIALLTPTPTNAVSTIWLVLDVDGSGQIRLGEFVATCTMEYNDKDFDKMAKET